MTKTELSKEMESSGFQVIKKIHLIITVISFFMITGISIGVSQNQLENKINSEEARKIAKEEVQVELKHFFTDSDGKVLQSQMQELKDQIRIMNDKLDKLLNRGR